MNWRPSCALQSRTSGPRPKRKWGPLSKPFKRKPPEEPTAKRLVRLSESFCPELMKIYELNHVAIHVKDVEASCKFYASVLRLEPISRPAFTFPGAWFRLGASQELHIIGNRT